MAAQPKIAKRFQPYLQQAATETDLQYGPQEAALQSILNQRASQYQTDTGAANTAHLATQSLLSAEPAQIQKAYSDAGLTPTLLSQLANSPTGQRIASEMASAQAAVPGQAAGESAGYSYQQGHLSDQFKQDVGSIQDQATALAKARGEYSSNLVDQLISGDRATRHAANQHIADQAFTAQQNASKDQSSLTNTLAGAIVGQGHVPVINSDGSVSLGGVIPGSKADPTANPPKRTTGPGTASQSAQRTYGTKFQQALSIAAKAAHGEPIGTPGLQDTVMSILTTGQKGAGGSSKQVKILNPDGSVKTDKLGHAIYKTVTTQAQDPQPAFDTTVAQAATEQALHGFVSTATVRALQKLGYSVNQVPGLITQGQYAAAHSVLNRPGTAPSRAQQPG